MIKNNLGNMLVSKPHRLLSIGNNKVILQYKFENGYGAIVEHYVTKIYTDDDHHFDQDVFKLTWIKYTEQGYKEHKDPQYFITFRYDSIEEIEPTLNRIKKYQSN